MGHGLQIIFLAPHYRQLMSFGPVVAEDLKITSINDPSFPLDLIIERLKTQAELFAVDFPLLERIILYRGRIYILETTPYVLGLEFRVDENVGMDEVLRQLDDLDDWSIISSSLVGEYIDREKSGRLLYARNAGLTPDPPLPGLQTENQEQKTAEKPDESMQAASDKAPLLPKHITSIDLAIMEEAAPELERLWAEIQPVLRYRESEIRNPHQALKERAKQFFVDYEKGYDAKWKRLRLEFLEDDAMYDFRRLGNEKEDFIGRLHQKILLVDNPIRRRKPGVQLLNDIHLYIFNRQLTKDQN